MSISVSNFKVYEMITSGIREYKMYAKEQLAKEVSLTNDIERMKTSAAVLEELQAGGIWSFLPRRRAIKTIKQSGFDNLADIKEAIEDYQSRLNEVKLYNNSSLNSQITLCKGAKTKQALKLMKRPVINNLMGFPYNYKHFKADVQYGEETDFQYALTITPMSVIARVEWGSSPISNYSESDRKTNVISLDLATTKERLREEITFNSNDKTLQKLKGLHLETVNELTQEDIIEYSKECQYLMLGTNSLLRKVYKEDYELRFGAHLWEELNFIDKVEIYESYIPGINTEKFIEGIINQ